MVVHCLTLGALARYTCCYHIFAPCRASCVLSVSLPSLGCQCRAVKQPCRCGSAWTWLGAYGSLSAAAVTQGLAADDQLHLLPCPVCLLLSVLSVWWMTSHPLLPSSSAGGRTSLRHSRKQGEIMHSCSCRFHPALVCGFCNVRTRHVGLCAMCAVYSCQRAELYCLHHHRAPLYRCSLWISSYPDTYVVHDAPQAAQAC